MTPCPNCSWPHHSPKPIKVHCRKCGTEVCIACETQTDLRLITQPKRDANTVVGWIKFLRSPEDKGLGDTVERLLAKAGGRRVKAWLQSAGIDCGCGGRQDRLNKAFPYPTTATQTEGT